mmetsp:Transcript_11546/g.17414  ORF Transcript_11546/g.17414 Transcript_11546/m.17414 type:complete len:262 (+) Transcript_11546:1238-2023(+)
MRKWMTPLRRKRANREGQKGRDPPPRNLRLPQPPLLHHHLLAVVAAAVLALLTTDDVGESALPVDQTARGAMVDQATDAGVDVTTATLRHPPHLIVIHPLVAGRAVTLVIVRSLGVLLMRTRIVVKIGIASMVMVMRLIQVTKELTRVQSICHLKKKILGRHRTSKKLFRVIDQMALTQNQMTILVLNHYLKQIQTTMRLLVELHQTPMAPPCCPEKEKLLHSMFNKTYVSLAVVRLDTALPISTAMRNLVMSCQVRVMPG